MSVRLMLASVLLFTVAATFAQASPDAAALMERSRQTTQFKGARIDMNFELNSASGATRTRRVSSVVRTQAGTGESSRLARFEFPADARGLATLLIEHVGRDDELWVYVPAVKKVRHLVADNKRDSFMGTVLSNADVLGHKPADWLHEIVGEDVFEGHKCWRVVSKPASDAVRKSSGYEHRESWIDQESAFNWRMDTWDESGKPLKSILNRKVQAVSQQPGAFLAYETEARDLQEGAVTKITVERFEFVPNLSIDEFKPTSMGDDF